MQNLPLQVPPHIFDHISNETWRLQTCSVVCKAAMTWKVNIIVPNLCGECPVKSSISWLLLLWQSYYYYNAIKLRRGISNFAPWDAQTPLPRWDAKRHPPPRSDFFVHLMLRMYARSEKNAPLAFQLNNVPRSTSWAPFLWPQFHFWHTGYQIRKKWTLLFRFSLNFCYCLSLYS